MAKTLKEILTNAYPAGTDGAVAMNAAPPIPVSSAPAASAGAAAVAPSAASPSQVLSAAGGTSGLEQPRPASVPELRAAFPDDLAFRERCLENNWSLLEARANYAAVLTEKLKAEKLRADKLENAAAGLGTQGLGRAGGAVPSAATSGGGTVVSISGQVAPPSGESGRVCSQWMEQQSAAQASVQRYAGVGSGGYNPMPRPAATAAQRSHINALNRQAAAGCVYSRNVLEMTASGMSLDQAYREAALADPQSHVEWKRGQAGRHQ
jgi:hypothetical protein